jgi:hypothetical protein
LAPLVGSCESVDVVEVEMMLGVGLRRASKLLVAHCLDLTRLPTDANEVELLLEVEAIAGHCDNGAPSDGPSRRVDTIHFEAILEGEACTDDSPLAIDMDTHW